jgi:hypothetical protein
MDGQATKEQLQAVLNEDTDKMLEEVVGAMNRPHPGSIIDDSEERVRQRPVNSAASSRRPWSLAVKAKLLPRPASRTTRIAAQPPPPATIRPWGV